MDSDRVAIDAHASDAHVEARRSELATVAATVSAVDPAATVVATVKMTAPEGP